MHEAYSVLGDPEARAQYDTLGVEAAMEAEDSSKEGGVPDPIACSVCGKVTAQPRYVIYYEVKSFVVMTTRSPIQGIFCPGCAERKVLRATVVTWLTGWWGFPWGPIYSIQAIFRNLIGGIRPRDVNARLVAYQAWVFARVQKRELARAVAAEALALAAGTKPDEKGMELRRSIHALLAVLEDDKPIKHLRSRWTKFDRPSLIQAGLVLAVIGAIWGIAAYEPPISSVPRLPGVPLPRINPPLATAPPPASSPSVPPPRTFNEPVQRLPQNGAYRRYWAHYEGEILAPLQVITAVGSLHYFVKVVDWDLGTPVLTVFVRSGQQVEVSVPLGSYRIKYAAGSAWYGERYLFGPETSYARVEKRMDFAVEGDRVAGFTIELIKQVGGNLKTVMIRPDEF